MRKYNYFDDDDVIESQKSLGDVTLDLLIAIKNTVVRKINEKKNGVSKPEKPKEEEKTQSAPESTIEPPKPSLQHTAVVKPKAEVVEEKDEFIEQSQELADALKAFSHKSGDAIKIVTDAVRERAVSEAIERTSKGKRFLITLGLFVFTILFFICVTAGLMHSITKENERIKEFKTNAGEVCSDYIIKYGSANYENLYDKYKVEGFRLTGLCFARELDFDNDGTSELLICYSNNGEYYNEVWGYGSSDDFELLFSEKAAQSEDKSEDAWSTLYYKNNKYCIGVHNPEDLTAVEMHQLKNGKFSKKFDCTYDPVTEAFSVNEKEDLVSFERIKLAVLRVEKAIVSVEQAEDLIDNFLGVENAGVQTNAPKSLEDAYYSVVQEYNKKYGVSKYVEENGVAYVDGLAVVDLIDFDNDGQNELFLVYRKEIKVRDESDSDSVTRSVYTYYADVYRYTGTRAVIAFTNEGISNSLNNSNDIYYILKKNKGSYDYCQNSFSTSDYGREIVGSTTAFEFDGESFNSYFNARYEEQYGYSEYYLEDDSVKKSVFEESCEGIPNYSDSDYDKSIYTIYYLSRAKKDADGLKSVPSDTEKEIQKLNDQYTANN